MTSCVLAALIGLGWAADEGVKPVFSAGTYGRVQASTDLTGGGGDRVNVVSHPPRLDLGPYLELDLGFEIQVPDGPRFDLLITPALSGELFHFDGSWGDDLALRNLYASVNDLGGLPLELWAGSRMYRGDDVYLLDFWPLDALNTFGGGAIWRPGRSEVAAHVGVNRLLGDDWQLQSVVLATPGGVQGEEVLVLDRQRTVTSLRVGHERALGKLTVRGRLYGELHVLPAGERVIDEAWAEWQTQPLPSDLGSLVGLQLSVWGWASQSFVHLWARRATGLAAVGELTIPRSGFDLDLRVRSAQSWLVALQGNTETDHVGVMAAAYAEYRVDADGQAIDFDDRWELVGVVRPQVYLGRHVGIAAEVSQQYVRPNGLNPRTGEFDTAGITKLSLLPGVQVDRGGYSRPRLQLTYTATLLGEGATRFFAPEDARVNGRVQHFVGVGAEWWANTSRVILPD